MFAPAAGAGERSETPAVQARFGHRRAADAGARWDFGVSGHYGRERRSSGATREWAAAGDASLDVGRVGFGAELYAGDAIAAFGGGLGQAIRSAGGFGEVRVRATERVSFNAGGGLDQVADRDRARVPLGSNRTWFGNAIFAVTPEIRTSLEYRHLETETSSGATRGNHHVNFTFVYAF